MTTEFMDAAVDMLGVLTVILAMIIGVVLFLKYYRFQNFARTKTSHLRLVNMLPLAPKKSLALVEIQDRWLVLAVTQDAVTLITVLDRPGEGGGTADEPKSPIDESCSGAGC